MELHYNDPIYSPIKQAQEESSSVMILNLNHDEDTPLAVVPAAAEVAPIVSSYNDQIRPVLDAIDKLRNLVVMEEGIELPTIVVVGDQSSGKSSVLESLARINLPRGQGICTRVPLVMRLQNHSDPKPDLSLEYNGKVFPTTEENVSEAINLATEVIAGSGKGISKTPLTLTVKKRGVPDLTMVDLPGITRVPVHGQPDNIYDQIRDIIIEYIKPGASIILNVLSATVDFPTCESIRMSQSVDKSGERTLAVVTKCDISPEGLPEKVTSDDVHIGRGYICVRNRIGDESYEEARIEENKLFASHPLLSKIDKSIVGVPVLAQKLMQIQAKSIHRNLPDIVKKINDRLKHNVAELNKLPKTMSSAAEAITVFMRIIGQVKESLRKILVRGEFDEYPYEKKMHCTARLVEMLNNFSDELNNSPCSNRAENFLMEEIEHLDEAKKISLPNFLPRTAFLAILKGKVTGISSIPTDFVGKVWDYIEEVVIFVLMHHVENYYQLQPSTRRAGLNLIEKMKERSMKWIEEVLEMEKLTDYTCNPEYLSEWNRLMAQKEEFMEGIDCYSTYRKNLEGFGCIEMGTLRPFRHPLDQAFDLRMAQKEEFMEGIDRYSTCRKNLEGFGCIEMGTLRPFRHPLDQAFDLRMRMIAYWRIVLRRLVDSMALHLQLSVNNLVNTGLESEIVSEFIAQLGNGIERLLEESPSVSAKRVRLTGSVKKLKESKEILAKIMGRIGSV